MISENPIEPIFDNGETYANMSQYMDLPSLENWKNGTVPLDTLPAAWWNSMWNKITIAVNQTITSTNALYAEILNILADAGLTPSSSQENQLLEAINIIKTRIGTAERAGAVKSSSVSGKVSIDKGTGIMTPNGLGIPSQLSTVAKSVVEAINELVIEIASQNTQHTGDITSINTALSGKAPTNHASSSTTYGKGTTSNYGHVKLSDSTNDTYDVDDGIAATPKAVNSLQTATENALTLFNNNKAPTNHASSSTTYGKGTTSNYGHVRLSDSIKDTYDVDDGIAATPKAVNSVYNTATSKASVANISASALDKTASAGTSSYAARADHVHPLPSLVTTGGSTLSKVNFTLRGTTLTITTTTI